MGELQKMWFPTNDFPFSFFIWNSYLLEVTMNRTMAQLNFYYFNEPLFNITYTDLRNKEYHGVDERLFKDKFFFSI